MPAFIHIFPDRSAIGSRLVRIFGVWYGFSTVASGTDFRGDGPRVSQAKTKGPVDFAWVPTEIEGDDLRVSQAKTQRQVDFAGVLAGSRLVRILD